MGSIPILETSETVGTPTTKTRSQTEPIRDDLVSQAMLRILKRVTETRARPVVWGSVIEWLHSNRVELFRGISRVAPIIAKYWLEAPTALWMT